MKTKHLCLLLLALATALSGCNNNDEPKDTVQEIRMEVSSETGYTYPFGSYQDPVECMLVKLPEDPDTWQPLEFGAIEGFTYEPNHEYYLSVKRTTLVNPPADASRFQYSLIKILMDRLVEETEEPEEKEITCIDDIDYEEMCPFNKYAFYESVYYIDKTGKITYSDGESLPGYDAARIYLDDVLPKDDPNFIKFNSVPYMAIYSFVFSPLTDEIRLVRNDSSGPMFKEVVPQQEFDYIVSSWKVGDELKYTVILANVYKLGLQQLNFTIIKK